MSKYEPLGQYLERTGDNHVELTFAEIEEILGFTLPDYLYEYPAGWYGTAEASPTHRQKVVWCRHGYQVETIDLTARNVRFRKVR